MDNSAFKIKNAKNKVSPARSAAFEILLKIEKEKAFSSILLPLYEDELAPNDAGLCHKLVLEVLRKQIYLDKIIENFTQNKLDLEVRIALRIGLYQLIFLNKVPSYSAINESVNLAAKAGKGSAKGLVNAILRRSTRENVHLDYVDDVDKISIETSHPRWLIEKWVGQFGIEETEKLAFANNETPKLDFRFTKRANRKGIEPAEQLTRSEILDLAQKGEIYFQDAGSQIVGNAINLQQNELFLDVCAAPGSKLSQIATSVKQNVFGGDLNYSRIRSIKSLAEKQGLQNLKILQYDAEKCLPFADETFDVVLLDAPCSGTGTIRHNPEIRYRLSEGIFSGFAEKQLNLVQNASKVLKRFGRLIYSTCSLEIEENEKVIENFMNDNRNFSIIRNSVYDKFANKIGFARTLPHRDGMDGFFIVSLRKM